jgi:peptidoglycan/LPS O-acetylase OafA/YrhL
MLVLTGHIMFRMPDNALGRPLLVMLRQLALVGVDIFLVLSGFLIGGQLLAEQQATDGLAVGRFLARRVLRLWPSYILVVLLAWGWYHWQPTIGPDGVTIVRGAALADLWPYLLHVQNYYDLAEHRFGASVALHTWTLAVVIHFYVLIALLIGVLARKGPLAVRLIPWVAAATAIGCLAVRIRGAAPDDDHFDAHLHYYRTHLRLDELMLGVLLAYVAVHHRARLERIMARAWPGVLAASAAALVPIALREKEWPPLMCTWGYSLAACAAGGFTITLWWLEQRAISRPRPAAGDRPLHMRLARLPARAIGTIGAWSYSIYLWHHPLCSKLLSEKIRAFVGDHSVGWGSPLYYPLSAALYMGASIGVGGAMYYLVERPSLALRERLVPARRHVPLTDSRPVPPVNPAPPRAVPPAPPMGPPSRAA